MDRCETVRELPSDSERLIVTVELPDVLPEHVFRDWTEPERLTRWWPQEAEIEPGVGGTYHLAWPAMDWHLRGAFTEWEPGLGLAFTWRWDHEPDDRPTFRVTVVLEPNGLGTRVTLEHGPYGDNEADREARSGHVEGWTYFLGRLRHLYADEGMPA